MTQTIFLDAARRAGAKPAHEALLLRSWLQGRPLAAQAEHAEFRFPASLVALLPELEAARASLLRLERTRTSADGTEHLLFALADGQLVESVLLPRDGLCVSTQVGCAVGCRFCKTGELGLVRNLSATEICAQVAKARGRRKVARVVFMGQGEPAHNLGALREALAALGSQGLFAHKNLIVSSVGTRPLFSELAGDDVRPALALSLHTTDAALRRELLPRAPEISPDALVGLAEEYARRTAHPIQYQWTLLAGVNDSVDEADRLASLLAGKRAIVNYIPFNEVEGLRFARPPWDQGVALVRHLRSRGVLATLRRSAGQDLGAACGQLAARRIRA